MIMNVFWIFLCICVVVLLSIEPIGYSFIKRTVVIYVSDSYKIQYHSGDTVTRMYIIEDENDIIYLCDNELPKGAKVEICYKGFNYPKLGLIRRIVDYKLI